LRVKKEEEEIAAIQKACKLGDSAFEYVLGKIKPGMSEQEVAFELEMFIKKHGAELSFRTIIASGKNSSVPHHQTSNQKLMSNTILLLDFGVKIDNYCSDMTRTIFLGKANPDQKKMYEAVRVAQEKAIEYLKQCHFVPQDEKVTQATIAKDVDKIARGYILSQGYLSIPHSLGHGTGLEVHEEPRLSPKSKTVLQSGMVFSIEPGIYVPDFGGVRIEDLVTLRKDGVTFLTNAPKQLIEL